MPKNLYAIHTNRANNVHDNGPTPPQSQLAVYVKLGASPTNTGLLPTSPLPTLAAAIAVADKQLATHWATVGKGVTINVFPGQYQLSQPLYLLANVGQRGSRLVEGPVTHESNDRGAEGSQYALAR